MTQDLVTLEIDGQSVQAPKGAMLIDVADAAKIHIPRFCYHKKLSVAANCRMCLVEVEKAPKPLPACATPVMPGMKVYTRSPLARAAQKGTMEFLLINHPLDCPICDQGGECELQDVAMGYGESVSRYSEAKRVVKDKDIGPLIETEMTRCIHCTRCVRFGEEIAGVRELGATGRGEFMRIGTFVEHTVSHELSGNVIDLCPVGALTAKPSRYQARAWEYRQYPSIAPHDGVGSNVFVHTHRGQAVRVVPRENEPVNETWISDRDRFSYTGLYGPQRLTQPRIKVDGAWRDATWEEALAATVDGLRRQAPQQIGALFSPSLPLEEMYLAQQVLRGLGVRDLDHRVDQLDFAEQETLPLFPWLGGALESLEQARSVLLLGCNPRQEQPMLAHRLRKAALKGAQVSSIHTQRLDLTYPLQAQVTGTPRDQVLALAALAAQIAAPLPAALADLAQDALLDAEVLAAVSRMAESLQSADTEAPRMILLGADAIASPQFAMLRRLAHWLAESTGAQIGYLAAGANAAGAWLSGLLPFRGVGGRALTESAGVHAQSMLQEGRSAFVLVGLEPERDCIDPMLALRALDQADFVVACSAFVSPDLEAVADVLLPSTTVYETTGTLINAEGRWQSFRAATSAPEGVRPGWKVWRVLGNLLEIPGMDYLTAESVRDALKGQLQELALSNALRTDATAPAPYRLPEPVPGLVRLQVRGLYTADALTRRAEPLQTTPDGQRAEMLRLHPDTAGKHADGARVKLREGRHEATLTLCIDPCVPPGVALTVAGSHAVSGLAAPGGQVSLAWV